MTDLLPPVEVITIKEAWLRQCGTSIDNQFRSLIEKWDDGPSAQQVYNLYCELKASARTTKTLNAISHVLHALHVMVADRMQSEGLQASDLLEPELTAEDAKASFHNIFARQREATPVTYKKRRRV